MDEENMVCMCISHTQWNITQLQKEIIPFATTWRDPEIITLSEVSQTEKDKPMTLPIPGI